MPFGTGWFKVKLPNYRTTLTVKYGFYDIDLTFTLRFKYLVLIQSQR